MKSPLVPFLVQKHYTEYHTHEICADTRDIIHFIDQIILEINSEVLYGQG